MKRIAALILTGLLCLTASGCASMLETEYLSVDQYQDEEPAKDGSAVSVYSYQGLKNAVIAMVEAHQTDGMLEFAGYSGDAEEDLPKACSEVKAESAICAYAVDYMSYSFSRIVSYYEARVYINYKRTVEQVEGVQAIGAVANAGEFIRQALADDVSTLALKATSGRLTADEVTAMVREIYYAFPLTCLRLPEVAVSIYPDVGVTRIYEIRFDYGEDAQEIAGRLSELQSAAETLAAQVAEGGAAQMAAQAAVLLAERCAPAAEDSAYGDTAYGALVEGSASGEGFAMAYKAVCDTLGLECLVVSGRLDKAPHSWNIVTVDGGAYHVDASRLRAAGYAAALRTDSEMWGHYWWDIDLYPVCEGPASPASLETEPANEPPAADVPSGAGDAAPEAETISVWGLKLSAQ